MIEFFKCSYVYWFWTKTDKKLSVIYACYEVFTDWISTKSLTCKNYSSVKRFHVFWAIRTTRAGALGPQTLKTSLFMWRFRAKTIWTICQKGNKELTLVFGSIRLQFLKVLFWGFFSGLLFILNGAIFRERDNSIVFNCFFRFYF